jgi:hypothetical protein
MTRVRQIYDILGDPGLKYFEPIDTSSTLILLFLDGNTFFQSLGGRGRFGTNWSTDVVEIATLDDLEKNDRFFANTCYPYIWVPLSDLFKHFTIIRTQRMEFRKMPEVRIKPDKC